MKQPDNFVRDKRSPIPLSESVSRVMRKNKSKNTQPELLLRKELWKNGIRGYRLHSKKLPGKPDIAFISKKIAIFVNGCFWHRCPHCQYKLPKTNRDFWKDKFERNIARDLKANDQLKEMKWKVITIWECELKNKEKLELTVQKIKDHIT
ncbi:very short patch repair endonuclease [Chryseobacterium sp. FH1]|uniref:very short patch repair endonuclease n=1 Tax=Chryseobacterium sp. FH1 TaxID=1233951 RepID=UPI0006895B00|nr:very short patch repair endonuclease [Chryseobacterium sp. FH1]